MAYKITKEDLQGDYKSTEFPSRYALGDEVWFQPDLSKIQKNDGAVRAQVINVKFTETKVLYDVALWDEKSCRVYDVLPLCNVDSIMLVDMVKQLNT